jgi:hypothetical protein
MLLNTSLTALILPTEYMIRIEVCCYERHQAPYTKMRRTFY